VNYPAIRQALMGDVPEDLDYILYLASRLGTATGWEVIERQAKEDGRELPRLQACHSYADSAVVAAIYQWPKNKDLLERANARARVHARSSYVYYAPSMDYRSRYRKCSDEALADARNSLAHHFLSEGLVEDSLHGRATEIIPYDFEKEIWFLIRYPGKKSRHSGCDRSGDWKGFVFNPEQYDAVVYNKVYGDLRMNTNRKRDHMKYRIVFGHLLFDEANVFMPKEEVVTLKPLTGDAAAGLFACGDVAGLTMIAPVEVTYDLWSFPPKTITEKARDGGTLLENNERSPRIVPVATLAVQSVVLAYQLADSTKPGKLTLQVGNRVTYERDGDSVVIEEWLRRRGFVKSFVPISPYDHLDETWPVAVGQ
jgi:hypothetical protein